MLHHREATDWKGLREIAGRAGAVGEEFDQAPADRMGHGAPDGGRISDLHVTE